MSTRETLSRFLWRLEGVYRLPGYWAWPWLWTLVRVVRGLRDALHAYCRPRLINDKPELLYTTTGVITLANDLDSMFFSEGCVLTTDAGSTSCTVLASPHVRRMGRLEAAKLAWRQR